MAPARSRNVGRKVGGTADGAADGAATVLSSACASPAFCRGCAGINPGLFAGSAGAVVGSGSGVSKLFTFQQIDFAAPINPSGRVGAVQTDLGADAAREQRFNLVQRPDHRAFAGGKHEGTCRFDLGRH